ncbi:MAG TPA: gephyrin-like molybdotransferase Glp [Vicinamibacteria bacterium]|nr:gephyrin-like molybdotransferase Glp [Vicinamibacteria bacterium]
MIPVEEALEIVLRESPALPFEEVALDDALSRVLAGDVASDSDLPPFDRAAMDGYALRAADVAGAPAALEVVGEVRAGQWPDLTVGPGQAVRIMTGAPVPPGADAVQQVEKTQPLDEFRVTILSAVAEGANVAPRGSEVRAGDLVLARGRVIDPAAIAVLASAGRARVRVARRPVVALLVTGDEIVEVSATPAPGQIRNSNGPAVAAQARLAGATVRLLGVAPDRQDAIAEALRAGLAADVLVVSGGVSAGDYDLVEPALLELGAAFLFTKVAVKPGAPLVFGRRGATLVFGLPGNPVSAQVTFDLFVRPALLKMQGATVVSRPRVRVELLVGVKNRSGRKSHVPARVRFEGGRLVARPLRSMGSGDLAAHARANALVVIEADRLQAVAGETAEAVLLGRFLEDDGAPL